LYENGLPQDFIYLSVNTAFENLTGLKDVVGKRITEVIPGIRETSPDLFEIYGRVALGGKSEKFESYLSALAAWFSISVYCPEPEHFVSVFENITDRKRMDEALHHRTDVLAALNQVTLSLVNRREMEDILQTLMGQVGNLLDVPHVSIDLIENEDELVTYAVTPGQPLQKGDRVRRGQDGRLSWQAIETGRPAILEDYSAWQERRPLYDGFPIHAILIVPIIQRSGVVGALNFFRSEPDKPFKDTDIYIAEQLAQMVALVLDNAQVYGQLQTELTERKRTEEELSKLAALEERQRMGRDLHDSVNQSIHSLVLFSETLGSALEKNHIERARQIAGRLQKSARQALKETRLMLYQLQPSAAGGIPDLIQELETRLATVERRSGIRAEIIQEGSLDDCSPAWNENLFWITIEALNNALKHAQARSVKIILRCSTRRLELEVLDDGNGFDPAKPHTGGLGLGNMRERAGLLGGSLAIVSAPGEGTRVLFSVEIEA
jgi:signal transduction histidine kinase